jgi:hypothetical protein
MGYTKPDKHFHNVPQRGMFHIHPVIDAHCVPDKVSVGCRDIRKAPGLGRRHQSQYTNLHLEDKPAARAVPAASTPIRDATSFHLPHPPEPSMSTFPSHDSLPLLTSQVPIHSVGPITIWDCILSVFQSKLESRKLAIAAKKMETAKTATHSVMVCADLSSLETTY